MAQYGHENSKAFPLITILSGEKIAIQHYLDHIHQYVNTDLLEHISPYLHNWPTGTKITRAKSPQEYRYLLIPVGTQGETLTVALHASHPDDIVYHAQHACTLVDGKKYYHQNKFDRIVQDDRQDMPTEDDSDEEEAAYFQKQLAENKITLEDMKQWTLFNEQVKNRRLGTKKEYLKSDGDRLFKQTIKYAVDDDGALFYLKSSHSFIPRLLHYKQGAFSPFNTLTLFRSLSEGDRARTKSIQITPDIGGSLLTYLNEHPSANIDEIAHQIIEQYLTHVYDRDLVHTDIKLLNLCIIESTEGLKISLIDWDEAFHLTDPTFMGKGTPGYMAPEFFKTKQNYIHQLDIRAEGEDKFGESLKEDYTHYFSQASDVFALGEVLREIGVTKDSVHYPLIRLCLSSNVSDRPNGEAIRTHLASTTASNIPAMKA